MYLRGKCAVTLPEKRGAGGAQVTFYWNSCGGIGRKGAFYNGFAGCVPTKSWWRNGGTCKGNADAGLILYAAVFDGDIQLCG